MGEQHMSMSSAKDTASAASANDFRLRRDVTPVSYRIHLEPDLVKKTFQGEVSIDVKVHEPVSRVTLNAQELQIAEAYATSGTGTKLCATVTLDSEREFAD